MTYKCPDCERNRLSAAMWRNEAYKHAGIELPWSPEEMIEEAVKEEREACAKACEAEAENLIGMAYESIALGCAESIRARGKE